MPWKECKPMDERLRFIARLLEGEQMASLCREFVVHRLFRSLRAVRTVVGTGSDKHHSKHRNYPLGHAENSGRDHTEAVL